MKWVFLKGKWTCSVKLSSQKDENFVTSFVEVLLVPSVSSFLYYNSVKKIPTMLQLYFSDYLIYHSWLFSLNNYQILRDHHTLRNRSVNSLRMLLVVSRRDEIWKLKGQIIILVWWRKIEFLVIMPCFLRQNWKEGVRR